MNRCESLRIKASAKILLVGETKKYNVEPRGQSLKRVQLSSPSYTLHIILYNLRFTVYTYFTLYCLYSLFGLPCCFLFVSTLAFILAFTSVFLRFYCIAFFPVFSTAPGLLEQKI